MYLAAVFANGHVETGRHHGEAFSKLSGEDQNCDLISGHVNPDGTFTTEMEHDHKEIVIVRHAESEYNAGLTDNLDSKLTTAGVDQAQKLAKKLAGFDCRGFIGFTSPFERCLLTSIPISRRTGIRFHVSSQIAELTDKFPEEGVVIPNRSDRYLDLEWGGYRDKRFSKEPCREFIGRTKSFFDSLPDKSIIITHGSVVQTILSFALGVKLVSIPTWDGSIGNASVTHVRDGTVICLCRR